MDEAFNISLDNKQWLHSDFSSLDYFLHFAYLDYRRAFLYSGSILLGHAT